MPTPEDMPAVSLDRDILQVDPALPARERAARAAEVGLTLYRRGDYFNAAQEFVKAAETGPGSNRWQTACRSAAAWCYFLAGAPHSFLMQYQALRPRVSDYALYEAGKLYAEKDDLERALKGAQTDAQRDSLRAEIRRNAALIDANITDRNK